MRPSAGGDALAPPKASSRKSSVADPSAARAATSYNVPTSFLLRSEEDMENSYTHSASPDASNNQKDSTYGVQSLADALESAFGPEDLVDQMDNHPSLSRCETSKVDVNSRPSSKSSSASQDVKSEQFKPLQKKQHRRQNSNPTISTPLTPLNLGSPAPNSEQPSTPKSVSLKSLKLSDEESGADESTSQAVISSGEDDEDDGKAAESGTFPQLVMPSIQMPSRRPFTTKGKAMGKLKIMVVGEEGIGKTSLIRSIVQLCEDIVHVDTFLPTQPIPQPSPPPKSKARRRKHEVSGTSRITEIHASTKAYPSWWTDMEESRTLRRRKSSLTDNVLERNLCFIDTPGYGKSASHLEDMQSIVDHTESLLHQNSSLASMEDGDLLGVLSGNGGVQIDAILYLLPPNEDISNDIEFMRYLSSITNVIPIIAKADILTPSSIISIKTSILARLQTAGAKPFLFGEALDDALLAVQGLSIDNAIPTTIPQHASDANKFPESLSYFRRPTYPYAVSSIQGSDTDTMDASLLMSPDYMQPLLPSELTTLITRLFDPDNIAWLKHSAVKKYIAWKRLTQLPGDSLIMHGFQQSRGAGSPISLGQSSFKGKEMSQESLSLLVTGPASAASSVFSSTSPSGVLVPRPQSPFYLSHHKTSSNLQSPFAGSSPSLSHTPLDGTESLSDFALTRFRDYAEREQYMGQVRLAKWASDLQRSLRNERERFEEMQRSERAKWLLERVSEEVRDGNISPTPSSTRADWAVVKHGKQKESSSAGQRIAKSRSLNPRDPLGLCDFGDEFRKRGFVVVKVLGGMGVLGAVVVAVVRACSGQNGFQEGGLWAWLTGSSE